MQCEKCSYTGPDHIRVVKGKVVQVDYISANGLWDRELEKDEWFVEYEGE